MATPTLPATLNVPIRLDLGRIPNDISDPALYREFLRIHDAIERLAVGFTETSDGGALEHIHDHGNLEGLGDDDHPQYLTNARGDIRYYTQAEVDALIADLENELEAVGLTLDGGYLSDIQDVYVDGGGANSTYSFFHQVDGGYSG